MIPFHERMQNGPPSVVITGARFYDGCTGKLVGLTQLLPPWYIVDLDDGRRVVVRPGHLEPLPMSSDTSQSVLSQGTSINTENGYAQ